MGAPHGEEGPVGLSGQGSGHCAAWLPPPPVASRGPGHARLLTWTAATCVSGAGHTRVPNQEGISCVFIPMLYLSATGILFLDVSSQALVRGGGPGSAGEGRGQHREDAWPGVAGLMAGQESCSRGSRSTSMLQCRCPIQASHHPGLPSPPVQGQAREQARPTRCVSSLGCLILAKARVGSFFCCCYCCSCHVPRVKCPWRRDLGPGQGGQMPQRKTERLRTRGVPPQRACSLLVSLSSQAAGDPKQQGALGVLSQHPLALSSRLPRRLGRLLPPRPHGHAWNWSSVSVSLRDMDSLSSGPECPATPSAPT